MLDVARRVELLALPLAVALLAACGSGAQTAGTATTGASSAASSGSGGGGGGASTGSSTGTGTGTGGASSSGTGGGPAACALPTMSAGDHPGSVMSGGMKRDYILHVPPGYTGGAATMLLLVFHGYLETDADIENVSKMNASADAHGFLVVYPQGTGQSWNAVTCCGTAPSSNVDDVKFTGDLLDQLEASLCVDPMRVYAAGYSNGGMFSNRLACELSNRIAAVGPVAGPITVPTCTPPRPVPVIEFHGTSDLVVPYDGNGLGGAKSVKDAIAEWVMIDGCTDAMPVSVYAKGDASCQAYTACAQGAAVEICTIDSGGHTWPGGNSPGGLLGKVSTDIDASETMFAFFAAHPMP